jgi:hypothetical protein
VFGVDYQLHLREGLRENIFNITVQDSYGKSVVCYSGHIPDWKTHLGQNIGQRSFRPYYKACRQGTNAAELLTTLGAGPNATQHEHETCISTVAIGWMRMHRNYDCDELSYDVDGMELLSDEPIEFDEEKPNNTFLMSCQPRLTIGNATIIVNSAGVLQNKVTNFSHNSDQSIQAQDVYFPTGVQSLMAQSNHFIFRTLLPVEHNDSFAAEPIHYFINRAAGHVRLTDPKEPLPQWEDVEKPMNEAYTRLFAIWLGVYKELLFVPSSNKTAQVPGTVITMEQRVMFRTPLFIISEIILGLYVIVATLVYFRRPGRYLPRMPVNIASVISLFAASAAVKDLQGTSDFIVKEREEHLKQLDVRYGYGSYIGGDGSVHVGIEKVPFVTAMKTTRFEHSRVDKELRRRDGNSAKERANVQFS